jgi:DeoR/GlpR family transcriptional regulator of sugar metabolism
MQEENILFKEGEKLSEGLSIRQKEILEEISRQNYVTVNELCKKFEGISHSTIRRDLKVLEDAKKITSFHGGVGIKEEGYGSFSEREGKYSQEKKRIGEKAAQLVKDGDTIYVGGGTTTYEFAKVLSTRRELNKITVITSAFNIARFFTGKNNMKVIIPCGELIDENESMTSNITINMLEKINYDKAFIGCYGITAKQGLMWPDLALSELKKMIVDHSATTILLTDGSKIGNISTISACDCNQIDTLITSIDADEEQLAEIETKGVKVIKV